MKAEMNLVKLVEEFGSEDACREYLAELRWPNGIHCPRCDSEKVANLRKRDQYECGNPECGYRFSVTSGTIFHDSHLPLWKWFLATYLICEAKKGVSANQLKRTLNVAYKTAWYLCHRIREAMKDEGSDLLTGIVEADETYVGGKPRVRHHGRYAKRDAARERMDNKTVVLGAVERGGKVRLRVAPDASHESVHGFLGDVVADEAEAIYTDSHRSYRGIGDEDTVHAWVDHSRDEWVNGQVHTNTVESVWSLFDRSVVGSYHKLSKKHLPRYLDEAAFRLNNRENPFLFRDTLRRLIEGDSLPYADLTAKKR
jgi:transposase-like protein